MGYCKPGPTCLYHGSQLPDADTSNISRTPAPGPVPIPIPYPNIAYTDDPTRPLSEPLIKEHVSFLLPQDNADAEEEKPDLVLLACKHNYEKNKHDCNHFVKAVERELGYSDFGGDDNANAITAIMEKSSQFKRLEDAKDAKQMAAEGYLVIAALRGKDQHKPSAHGHVAIVVDGPLNNGIPTGYWGSLGGTPKKNSSLAWAWTQADLKKVEYFARL